MKLTIESGSENYACQVIRLPIKQQIPTLDKLCKVTVFGNDVLTQKTTDENALYLFFPAECQIAPNYLYYNNEYRDKAENKDNTKSGYFEGSGRVKVIKFKGVISTGYLAPVSTLGWLLSEKSISSLKEGDEFTHIEGVEICKKYKIIHVNTPGTKESRFNKKLTRFNKLVPNQFRFHESTSHLAKNLHQFNPDDIIVITDKWHGTSAVFSNVLIKKELSWVERLIQKFGFDILTTRYDRLYSSRSVIKNQYINKEQNGGYYGEDIWAIVNKELEDKIEPGISIYGEIVGYLPSGKMIQKGYSYGCKQESKGFTPEEYQAPEHNFLVYRITYTKPDGNVIELSWSQIKNYCKKYSLETVPELYFGSLFQLLPSLLGRLGIKYDERDYMEKLFQGLCENYLEKDCKYNPKGTPAEGIVVRRDGQETFSAFKLKSKRFLEFESKQLDSGEINIEDDATVDIN